ncbi:hypothetical protein [Streptomyces lavendulae]|uniref:hypothetical protein n=1 Tax=Streptomyces lavendulae TaxID=1914 RepID=UPI0024A39F62|nr:hypothetical protein [Streptomyces lavendulae]GLW00308.1 hypothetical protein Slala05_39390 [Streptomyces lavendulae subsp. lavendulae]
MSIRDGEDLPDPSTVSAGELGRILHDLAGLADELAAPVLTEELRLAQYRRVVNLGEWITKAADSLHYDLDRQVNPDEFGDDD